MKAQMISFRVYGDSVNFNITITLDL